MGNTGNVLVGSPTSITIDRIGAEDPGGLQTAGLLPITGFYTTDGAQLIVRSSFADIKVEENIGTIIRRLTDQEVQIVINIAEGELANLVAAIPGSSINAGGDTITIGGSPLQGFSMVLVGEGPAGATRTITLTRVQPVGEVGIPYRKDEISIVPVTFSCIVADTGIFGTIEDL